MSRQKLHKTRISDLRVLACGIALKQYPRDDMLWKGLSRLCVNKLIDLRFIQDYLYKYQGNLSKNKRKDIFRKITRKALSFYSFFRYIVSISQTARKGGVDVILVFPRNHCLAICLALLRFYHGAKIYFDLYVSHYSIATSNSLRRYAIARSWIKEFLSIKFVDQLICPTPEYARYYQKTYKAGTDKFSAVRDGVQDIWFEEPVNVEHVCNLEVHRPKRVLYWGTFLIQHGVDIIINVAEELEDEDIEFIFCGGGKKETYVREQVRKKNLNNVVFKGYILTTRELIHLVDSVDVTFGHLKDTHDARLMASNKTKEGMARGKPVITLWTKQKEDLYQTKDNPFPSLIMIKNPDSKSLAKAIREVIKDPQKAEKIGNAARLMVKKLHGVKAVTSALEESFNKAFHPRRDDANRHNSRCC